MSGASPVVSTDGRPADVLLIGKFYRLGDYVQEVLLQRTSNGRMICNSLSVNRTVAASTKVPMCEIGAAKAHLRQTTRLKRIVGRRTVGP